jgi:hypothetical protein
VALDLLDSLELLAYSAQQGQVVKLVQLVLKANRDILDYLVRLEKMPL